MKRTKVVQSNNALTNNIGFYFDKVAHKYVLDGEECISGTQWLARYTKEFDKHSVAGAQAKRTGISAVEIMREWAVDGESSINFGNYIHSLCQLYTINRSKLVNRYGGIGHYVDVVVKMLDKITKNYKILLAEDPKVSRLYKIGFTADIILEHIPNESDPTVYYVLADFKTAKILTNEEYRDSKTKYDENGEISKRGENAALLDEPFKSLGMRNTAIDKATIQTSLYSILLASDETWAYWNIEDLENVERWVIHIPENSERYPDGYEIYLLENVDSLVLNELALQL